MTYSSRLLPPLSSVPLRHTYFYTGRMKAQPCESGVHPTYAYHLCNAFRKYVPQATMQCVTHQGLEQALLSKKKAVLVIPGGHAIRLTAELAGLACSIRKKIHSGEWNFFGSCAGAIYASQGLAFEATDPISIEPSFLGLAPFRAAGFPYAVSGHQFIGAQSVAAAQIRQESYRFKAHWNAGPCLQLTSPDSSLRVLAEFADEQFKKPLGVAALEGRYGLGKFAVYSYHPEVGSSHHTTGMSPELQKVCLGKTIQNIVSDL